MEGNFAQEFWFFELLILKCTLRSSLSLYKMPSEVKGLSFTMIHTIHSEMGVSTNQFYSNDRVLNQWVQGRQC